MEKPSFLTGKPVFRSPIPIIRPNFNDIRTDAISQLAGILESNMVTGVNRVVREFEQNVSRYFQTPSVAVSSCTAGMILTMEALGIRKREVILPSFSFSATAHMAYWTNNEIVFADIDRNTLNLDPESVARMVTPKTGAILAVHMYGNPAPIKELQEIAEAHDLFLLFDAAHAFGTKYRGSPVGRFGTASSYSLSPTKVISTVEGGIVSSTDEELLSKLELLRNYGNDADYNCPIPGINARMSELYAAIGNSFLPMTDEFIANRNRYVKTYVESLKDIPGLSFQHVDKSDLSTHKDFSIFVDEAEFGLNRDQLGACLKAAGISFKHYFSPPIHHLTPYRSCRKDGDLPHTTWASANVLSLPIWNKMPEDVILAIAEEIRKCHESAAEIKTKL